MQVLTESRVSQAKGDEALAEAEDLAVMLL
jgi:hypothetical protein